LRRFVLEHHGQHFNGTIRNVSSSGALIEGLWNVPVGTVFEIPVSDARVVTAITRWSADGRIGIEFEAPLPHETGKAITAIRAVAPDLATRRLARKAG
jgi:hypothetical protein